MDYKVTWSVDIFDAANPHEAALKAWKQYFQNSPDRIANVFTVQIDKESGAEISVDLQEEFAKELETENIYDRLGQYLSEDESRYPKVVEALRKALEESPDSFIDSVNVDPSDEDDTLQVWEKVELSFTVEEFCALVGIKSDEVYDDREEPEARVFRAMMGGTDGG